MVVHIVDNQVLQTGQPHLRPADIGKLARLVLLGHFADSLDVLRSRSTASTDHIQPALLEEQLVGLCHVIGRLVVSSHSVRKTSIRIHVHETFHNLRQAFDKRNHVRRTQSAVQTNAHGLGVTDRGVESLTGLARQGTARLVYKGTRNKHRDIQTAHLQKLPKGIQGSLGVQCVENGLNHEDVGSSIHQSDSLFKVRFN